MQMCHGSRVLVPVRHLQGSCYSLAIQSGGWVRPGAIKSLSFVPKKMCTTCEQILFPGSSRIVEHASYFTPFQFKVPIPFAEASGLTSYSCPYSGLGFGLCRATVGPKGDGGARTTIYARFCTFYPTLSTKTPSRPRAPSSPIPVRAHARRPGDTVARAPWAQVEAKCWNTVGGSTHLRSRSAPEVSPLEALQRRG